MRKTVAVVLAVVATLWLVVPADAQAPAAPAPKVTISGFVDNITSFTHNLSIEDSNYARNRETEWYARTRIRPDITAEVGTTKFVLGLEMDHTWGQTGSADNAAPNRFGTSGSWDLNTDTAGTIELKWGYTEFDLPLVPWNTRVRLGAQPFQSMYKLSYANGDFAGVNVISTVNPMLKLHFTYVQIEEESTGPRDGFARGDDYGIIASVEITPFKGLDIRPIVSYLSLDGITNGSTRQGRGGVNAGSTTTFPLGATETRWTLGVDARWRSGPFSIEPTVLYQTGQREMVGTDGRGKQDRRAWFVDVRGGWQVGPLLLEGAVIYTTGNKASDDVRRHREDIHYFEPLNTDTSYYGGWAEIWALGIDYFNIMYARAAGLNPGVAIGYDKYGLLRLGFKPSYAVTPSFTVRGAVAANWTPHQVDSSSTLSNASGLTPGDGRGDARYLGTEVDLGLQWRFAPNVAFDLVGAYMFSGNALSQTFATGNTGTTSNARDPQDVQSVVARVRYSF